MLRNQVAIGELVEPAITWDPLDEPSQTFQYIDLGAIDQDAKRIIAPRTLIGKEAPSRARQLVSKGDVLVSTVRPNLNGVAVVPPELDGATASTGFCVLRTRPNLLDSSYLFHWVKSPHFVADMTRKATGASYPAVSDRIIFESKLPLPSIKDQRRIAVVLDRAEALRAKRRAALVQLDTLTQSIFLDLFGDPLSTNGTGKHASFRSITRRITYGFTSPMRHLDDGIPIITAKNVRQGFIDFDSAHHADKAEFDALTDKSKPHRDDVLVTKDGTIGRCAVVNTDKPFCINQSVALIKPLSDKVLSDYVAAYLSSDRVQSVMQNMGKGNALAHLQITELAELPIPLPTVERQEEFCQRKASVEKLRAWHLDLIKNTDELFQVLQSRAFQGML